MKELCISRQSVKHSSARDLVTVFYVHMYVRLPLTQNLILVTLLCSDVFDLLVCL